MRLTEKNISHVIEMQYKGLTYVYVVAMKSNRVSDTRSYSAYDQMGRKEEYKKEWLPDSIQNFINKHNCILVRADEDYTEYRYQ